MPKKHQSIVTQLPLAKLVTHESSAVKSRVQALPDKTRPVLVKPLEGTDLYYVINGTNRVYRAKSNGASDIDCLIATPDFSSRIQKIVRSKTQSESTISLSESDAERQHQFHLDTDRFSTRASAKTDRGTIVRITLEIQIGDSMYSHFSLPLKGLGGLVFDPSEFLKHCNNRFIDSEKLLKCWGDDAQYDPKVLPSFLEVSEDGSDMFAGGFLLRQAFWKEKYSNLEDLPIQSRGQVVSVIPLVLYPNGLVWEGPIEYKPGETYAIVWSDHLLNALNDSSIRHGFSSEVHWWQRPTSVILNREDASGSCTIVHTCGSTCEGGGCLV